MQNNAKTKPRLVAPFALGKIVATPGAINALEANSIAPATLLERHADKDWGDDLELSDWQLNDHALLTGERILSSYKINQNERVWVITEHDRSITTILLPEEY